MAILPYRIDIQTDRRKSLITAPSRGAAACAKKLPPHTPLLTGKTPPQPPSPGAMAKLKCHPAAPVGRTPKTHASTHPTDRMCHTCQNGRATCRIRPERAKALRKEQKKHTPRALQTSPSQAGQADPLTPLPGQHRRKKRELTVKKFG